MAEKNLTQTRKHSRPTRASERAQAVHINAAHMALKWLMTEQCRTDSGGYVTVYQGTHQELLAAGVPENAFAPDFDIQLTNACCTGDRERVTGSMREVNGVFELEIRWGRIRPYMQGSHPALSELARMMLIDMMRWTNDYKTNSMEQPFSELAADKRATDFKPPAGARKFKVTPEFHKVLRDAASRIYQLVHTEGEILLAEPEREPERPSSRGNVVALKRHKST